jgi:hypothetical protein
VPALLDDRLGREEGGAEPQDPPDLGVEITGAEVEVEPVLLLLLVFRHPLQEDLDPVTAGRYQAPVPPARGDVGDIPEDGRPEVRRPAQVRAVDHDDQLAVAVRMGPPAHDPFSSRPSWDYSAGWSGEAAGR